MARSETRERTKREDLMIHPEPGPEHQWLEKFLGEWEFEGEMQMESDKDPHETAGDETVRPLGELWVVMESTGPMPDGSDAESVMIIGYDPLTARFIGSWTASMMTSQWVYEGDLDEDNDELTLYAEGPDFSGAGTTAMFRDVFTFENDDHHTLRSFIQEKEGEWRQFAEITYRRKVA